MTKPLRCDILKSSNIPVFEVCIVQLSVKKRGQPPNDLRFKTGPIYIGRQVGSQVFLPDRSVSRQHSVIYQDSSQKWIVEDLGSTNKTYVNNQAVHKQFLKHNDLLNVGDFLIRVSLEEPETPIVAGDQRVATPIHLDDTVAGEAAEIQQIVRLTDAKQSPPISIPAKRIHDIQKAMKEITKTTSIGQLHGRLLSVMLKQFTAHSAWAALRTDPAEPMTIEDGKKVSSLHIDKNALAMPMKIPHAMEKHKYLLLPQIPRMHQVDRTRSVMIAPILQSRNCLGVLYVSNTVDHQPYELADLDYLILISLIAENQIEKF